MIVWLSKHKFNDFIQLTSKYIVPECFVMKTFLP